MGPGTHIIERINNRIKPTNRTDFVAMLHDVDYLMGSGDYSWTREADDRALSNADWSLGSILMKAGLTTRKVLDLPFNPSTKNQKVANRLMSRIKQSSTYAPLFGEYGIEPDLYPNSYNK